MNIHLKITLNRIVRFSYLLGSACLLVGLLLSFVDLPGEAVGAPSADLCAPGYVAKDENPPWDYSGSEIITKVIVKSGQGCISLTLSNPNDGCYKATGLGTNNVKVSRIGEESSQCQAISHVYFYAGQVKPSPTPTSTATNTPTPTDTPVATDPIVTLTPTDTPTPTTTDPSMILTPTEPTPTGTATKTRKPPATLPPPTPFSGSPSPQVLIPQTGSRLAAPGAGSGINAWLLVPLGVGVFGLGLAFYGIANRLKRQ